MSNQDNRVDLLPYSSSSCLCQISVFNETKDKFFYCKDFHCPKQHISSQFTVLTTFISVYIHFQFGKLKNNQSSLLLHWQKQTDFSTDLHVQRQIQTAFWVREMLRQAIKYQPFIELQMVIYLKSLSSMVHFPFDHMKELELGHNCAKQQVKAWGRFFLQ